MMEHGRARWFGWVTRWLSKRVIGKGCSWVGSGQGGSTVVLWFCRGLGDFAIHEGTRQCWVVSVWLLLQDRGWVGDELGDGGARRRDKLGGWVGDGDERRQMDELDKDEEIVF